MPKISQNIVILMEDHSNPSIISMKAGNMCLNRFCIDENAAFALSGVYFLKKWSLGLQNRKEFELERIVKG